MAEIPSHSENPEEEPKRETGVSKIVGFDAEQEKEISARFKNTFEKQSEQEIFVKEYEREKTEEEKRMIASILEKVGAFVEKYGGTPVSIKPHHIHILDKKKLDEEARKKSGITGEQGGGYALPQQLIYIVDAGNDLENAQKIIHEILHFNSFQSVELTEKDKKVFNTRRIGLEVHSKRKKEIFFTGINEAVNEELAKRFDREYFPFIPEIADEVEERETIKKHKKDKGEEIARVKIKKKEGGRIDYISYQYVYKQEREKLDEIIKEIYKVNKEEEGFTSQEEVFDIFAKAAMTGQLLKVADLYERTFGKNSFRALGEETKKK